MKARILGQHLIVVLCLVMLVGIPAWLYFFGLPSDAAQQWGIALWIGSAVLLLRTHLELQHLSLLQIEQQLEQTEE